ncbi:MAG: FAD/NAD(P)-binding protein [Bacteroidia bacterium]|nr:FAD/NAD(P)-binding protein [Bacteroidia bacterium]NNF82280.1 hypothetical protein [Flavobacteriaceae bacterium]
MNNTSNKNIIDITFIGSGISTSFTLIALLESLQGHSSSAKPLKIALIERDPEFFTGLAYGPRSGSSALLITSLADFLPEGPVRDEFISWLNLNKKELLDELKHDGGDLSLNWIRTHRDEIEAGDWLDIYIPRRFFGKYIREKVEKVIRETEKQFPVELIYIQEEVIRVHEKGTGFELEFLSDSENLFSEKVVVSVGIPPVNTYWDPEDEARYAEQACLIRNPYSTGLSNNLDKIESYLAKRNDPSNVLIIGANASAMEMIYKLNDRPGIRYRLGKFKIVSPQGELPNSAQDDFTRMVKFIPENLLALRNNEKLTAWDIYKAANLDLDAAEHRDFGTAISETPISTAFLSLLGKLDDQELKSFACHYGNEIGKRQRRAGKHYTDIVDHLMAQNRINNIKGYFNGISPGDHHDGVIFEYRNDNGKLTKTHPEPVHLLISCAGAKTLENKPLTSLLEQLMADGLCKPNPSKRGFIVDNKMQAVPGLFISGPLLAGNVINGVPYWHLEHCGRIIALSKALGNELFEVIRVRK